MSIALAKPGVTPEQLLALPDAIGFELIDGKLKERTLGSVSSYIGGTVFFLLRSHVRSHQLGWVFPADGGYQCWPDSPHTVRRPDVSFVRGDRLRDPKLPGGWLRMAPDLVVEVVSPHDPMI